MIIEKPLLLSEKRTQLIVWNLLFLMPIIGMAVDLVAPSLPAIATNLHISHKVAKDVISIYLLGYALGNFFTGFLTDIFGRQRLLRIQLFSFVIVSLVPVFFPHIGLLLLARLFQGIALGGLGTLTRAIFSDILPQDKLVRIGTLMGTMWGLGPVLGPVIGGYLQFYFNWQAGFYFLAFIGFVGFVAAFSIIPETQLTSQPLNIKIIKNNLMEVLSHRVFMGLLLLMGLAYSLMITFHTAGPFLIQKKFNYTPIFFGHLALILGVVFLAATFICRHLIKTIKVETLLAVIINISLLVALLSLAASYFYPQSIVLIAIASAWMFFTCGFIYPMSMGKGISFFRHIVGTASAVMYLINILITSLTAFLVSFVTVQSTIALISIYVLLLITAALINWKMLR